MIYGITKIYDINFHLVNYIIPLSEFLLRLLKDFNREFIYNMSLFKNIVISMISFKNLYI